MADDGPKIDDRVEYVKSRVMVAFKHLKADKIEKGFMATESLYVGPRRRWRPSPCR